MDVFVCMLYGREDKKWMYFSGQHWTIDDDKNPNNATFYKSSDTVKPDRERPEDVKWNGVCARTRRACMRVTWPFVRVCLCAWVHACVHASSSRWCAYSVGSGARRAQRVHNPRPRRGRGNLDRAARRDRRRRQGLPGRGVPANDGEHRQPGAEHVPCVCA